MEEEPLSPLESLAVTLFDIGAIQFGKFKLYDGSKTTVYIDLRLLVSFPSVLRQVASLYHEKIMRLGLEFDILTAPPMAGLPIATALCLEMNRPLIYPRKTAKSYGSGKGIEGTWSIGQKALVIDDVVDTGQSIVRAIAALKAKGLQISDAIVFIDREHGGTQLLKAEGYRLFHLLALSDVLAILRDEERISQRQYNKAMQPLR
jgi:uridine monophosphate synthetase